MYRLYLTVNRMPLSSQTGLEMALFNPQVKDFKDYTYERHTCSYASRP